MQKMSGEMQKHQHNPGLPLPRGLRHPQTPLPLTSNDELSPKKFFTHYRILDHPLSPK
jgi:hypothetical protein